MAKKSKLKLNINNKNLGIALIVALIIQFVIPVIKLGQFAWIATLIYLVVALILLFFK